MVGFKKQSKSSKRRGDREQGRGKKKGRGAGLRGGKGNAGRHKHKRVHYAKLGQEFGYTNFGFKIPDEAQNHVVAVNVSELDQFLPHLLEMGEVEEADGVYSVNLTEMGIDKLLGSGQVRSKLNITVETATPSAKAKVEEAGGSIVAASE